MIEMRFINFGSLNIDHVFCVEHIILEGETLKASSVMQNIGGKGLNQSIALARAGGRVCHAGMIGADGLQLKLYLEENGVDTSLIKIADVMTGTAFIQVTPEGKNSIVVSGGANQKTDDAYVDFCFEHLSADDVLLLQNEISNIPYIMKRAREKGMTVVFNPSPADNVREYPLECVDMFILNEHECRTICNSVEIGKMHEMFPNSKILLTMGERGAVFSDGGSEVFEKAESVDAVDTTGAGDTFTGYFMNEYFKTADVSGALKAASHAAAIAVTRSGAAQSIPTRDEVSGV
ncbi:MAG: ribokinase [Clostridiales bacterium]|nr:ribokinase [Clostridiales bacterium]